MSEEVKEEEKKKGVLGKIKDNILPDQEEQAAIISTFVRLGVLVWSGGILTLKTASKKGDGTMKMDAAAKAAAANGNGGTVQTIKIQQMPLKIIAADIPDTLDPKKDNKPTA